MVCNNRMPNRVKTCDKNINRIYRYRRSKQYVLPCKFYNKLKLGKLLKLVKSLQNSQEGAHFHGLG